MDRIVLILLYTLSCNLDTLLLSVRCALDGGPLSGRAALTVAALTSAITGLSLLLGTLAGRLLRGAAGALGPLALILMGLWSLADGLRHPEASPPRTGNAALLAGALALNNGAAGIAAGASGLPPLPGAAANFAVTLALIALGGRLAGRLREAGLARRALPLSGLLLAALGALALLFGA